MTQLPNIITLLRIIGAISLLLCDVTGVVFWIIYALCGISDIADGWLARKLKCVTRTGALLDSLADICFVACCAWKFLPILDSALPLCFKQRTAAMVMAVGRGHCRNQSCESALGTRDVRALLLPSHRSEQVGGIPALHRSPNDVCIRYSSRHCGHNRHVCRYTRGTFYKNK
jgi:hypothetical protein